MVSEELMVGAQISAERLRLMNAGDLAQAAELSSAAEWNQTPDDWQMLMELQPQGCFAIEADGRLASTTTLVCYQKRLAWVGMVLTRAEYRGRGFASRLFTAALRHADSLGIETIKLDATEQGRPLYETFGFQAEQAVERWSRPEIAQSQTSESQRPTSVRPLSRHLRELDSQAFGADRSLVRKNLAQRSTVYSGQNAFLFSRPGRTTDYLGPCVASDPDAARTIITSAIKDAAHNGWSWDLMATNKDAVTLATELGFVRQRCLTRMVRGKPLRGREEMVYAIAGFELG